MEQPIHGSWKYTPCECGNSKTSWNVRCEICSKNTASPMPTRPGEETPGETQANRVPPTPATPPSPGGSF